MVDENKDLKADIKGVNMKDLNPQMDSKLKIEKFLLKDVILGSFLRFIGLLRLTV